jgi:peroxiredoxin Q/BCP
VIGAGGRAPDFVLEGSDGRRYDLTRLRREGPVLLVFYPANDSPGCNRQLVALEEEWTDYRFRGVQPFGVNPASAAAHAGFAARLGIGFPLLSDPSLEVCRAYGAVEPGTSDVQRGVVLIDQDGTILAAIPGAPGASIVLEALGPEDL